MLVALCFTLFSGLLVGALIMSVFSRQSVHAVLWLVVAFFATAWIYLLLSAQFIAMLLIIVYVGAIATLFLFVVMMLEQKKERAPSFFTAFLSFFALACMAYIFASKTFIYKDFNANVSYASFLGNAQSDVMLIGEVLYTDYFTVFQICGILLCATMFGIIYIVKFSGALGDGSGERRQSVLKQVLRRRDQSVTLAKDVKIGQGVNTK